MKIKRISPSTLSFIGAAINQGQKITGVEKAPQLIRDSNMFNSLTKKFDLNNIKDYGDIGIHLLTDN